MNWLDNLDEIVFEDIRQGDMIAFKMFAGYVIVDEVGEFRGDVFYNTKNQKIGGVPNIHKTYLFEPITDVTVKTRIDIAQLALDLGRDEVAEDILDELLDSGVI